MSNLYHIGSTARITGSKGQGTAKFPLSVARQLAEDLNKSESGKFCYHYPVAADDDEQTVAQQAPQGNSLYALIEAEGIADET